MHRFLVPAFIVFCTLTANGQQVQGPFERQGLRPKDGSALLGYCEKLVRAIDEPTLRPSDSDLMQTGWCAGYVQAIVEHYQLLEGLMTQGAFDGTTGPLGTCVPSKVQTGQVARVIVKWLRDHPERLHEDITAVSVIILHDAFPCQAKHPSQKELPK